MDGPVWWAGVALAGAGVGVVSGMFGVGGGFLLTPILGAVFGVPLHLAVGTGLCQMIGTATAAQIRATRLGQGESMIVRTMLAPSLIGVTIGARMLESITAAANITLAGHLVPPGRFAILMGHVVLLGLVAAWMAYDLRRPSLPQGDDVPAGFLTRWRVAPMVSLAGCHHEVSLWLLGLVGLLGGFMSGFIGIGGGVLLVPILVSGIGMRMRLASGSTGALVMVTAAFGTVQHAAAGNVMLGVAMVILAGSTIGAQAGVVLAGKVVGHRLRVMFVALVLATLAAVIVNVVRLVFAS